MQINSNKRPINKWRIITDQLQTTWKDNQKLYRQMRSWAITMQANEIRIKFKRTSLFKWIEIESKFKNAKK